MVIRLSRESQHLRAHVISQYMLLCMISLFVAVGCVQEDEDVIPSDRGETSDQAPPTGRDMTDGARVDVGSAEMDLEMSRDVGERDQGSQPLLDVSLNVDMAPLRDLEVQADLEVERDAEAPLVDMALDMELAIDQALPPPPAECGIQISLNTPSAQSFHHHASPPLVSGVVFGAQMIPVSGATVSLQDRFGNTLTDVDTDPDGAFSFDLSLLQRPVGLQAPQVRVRIGEQACTETAQVSFYLCSRRVDEDFTELPMSWTLVGDASWDARGWLEMTGISQGQGGAAYNDSENIQSGLASLEFTLSTGGGINGGADGFAFSIAELENAEALLDLIDAANNGGGLGYAVSGAHAEPDYTLPGDMLTVEIDTWYNRPGGRHVDPTPQNHIAITRNGDPGDHIAWFEVAQIEDLMPHTARVDFIEGSMRIFFDGALVIEREIDFTFKGGYMFFSGSTGYATNYHRFDNLKILHECQ